MNNLRFAAWFLLVGWVLHTGDHLRRGLSASSTEVQVAGTFGGLLIITALGLAFGRHRMAPLAAAVMGLSHVVGVSAVHLLPESGFLSDSLLQDSIDSLTWIAVLAEIVGALIFGLTGLSLVRSQGLAAAAAPDPGSPNRGSPNRRWHAQSDKMLHATSAAKPRQRT